MTGSFPKSALTTDYGDPLFAYLRNAFRYVIDDSDKLFNFFTPHRSRWSGQMKTGGWRGYWAWRGLTRARSGGIWKQLISQQSCLGITAKGFIPSRRYKFKGNSNCGVYYLRRSSSSVATEMAADILEADLSELPSSMSFSRKHWIRIRTNNATEKLNREIRRRTKLAGNFPDGQSALMLVAAILRCGQNAMGDQTPPRHGQVQ